MKRLLLSVLLAASFAGLQSLAAAEADRIIYPQAPKRSQVDDYLGTKVADPYRDLENADSAPTKKWIEAENKLTFDYLAGIPERKRINQKLTALWDYEKYSVPFRESDRYFLYKNTALQNQRVLYTTFSLPGAAKSSLDPNTLATED